LAQSSDAELVIAARGDGLINKVINGLQDIGCIFYSLSFGTANVFCRKINVPLNPLYAISMMNLKDLYNINLGKIEIRYFIQMTGFGFDATVVKNLNSTLKKINGKAAHLIPGIRTLLIDKFNGLNLIIDSKRLLVYHIIVSLGNKYAGNFNLSQLNKSDGKFLVCSQRANKKSLLLYNIVSIATNKEFGLNQGFHDNIKIEGTK